MGILQENIINNAINKLEESYKNEPIRINTTDFIKSISGLENIGQGHLILAGKQFRKRRYWTHKQDYKTGKRFWEYPRRII